MNDTLGSHIRKLRKQRNLTLQEVSKLSGISLSYLSDIERNVVNPSYKVLYQLAEVLHITTPEIVNVNNVFKSREMEIIETLESVLAGFKKVLDIKTRKEK